MQLSSSVEPVAPDTDRPDFREAAQFAADLVLAASGVDLSGLAMFRPDGRAQMVAAAGHRSDGWAGLVIDPGDGVAGQVLSRGGSVSLSNYQRESGSSARLVDVFSRGESGFGMLAVPVGRVGLAKGVLYAGVRRPGHVGDRGRASLLNVAGLVNVALAPQPRPGSGGPVACDPHHRTRSGALLRSAPLSERELKILRRLGEGLATRDVAAAEHLAINTVRSYVQSALWKLGAHSRLQAVAIAREAGLI